MYIDLIVIIVLLALVIFYFRRFSNFVYAFAIIDIFLRILNFIENNVKVPELQKLISKYFPDSIEALIYHYTDGILTTILLWVYVVIFAIFLGYVFKIFIKRRK
ncbi:MAG: hypothetical protein IKQ35_03760 [Bacilli bacterium]|nr:hypothetical protein [Bacilli bacterium]